MSNYKGHCSFNILLTLPVLIVAGYFLLHPNWEWSLTFSLAFLYGTFFMSPDLDLAEKIRLFSLRGFLTLPFRSYSKFFHHRGLSHSILFGTLTRILWLSLWAVILFFVIYQSLPSTKPIIASFQAHKWFFIYGISGLFAADISHILLDKIS